VPKRILAAKAKVKEAKEEKEEESNFDTEELN